MNTASRGVVLAIAAVILGVVILGQGFDDPDEVITAPVTADDSAQTEEPAAEDGDAQPSDDGGDDGSTEQPADDTATDGGDDGAGEQPADDTAADGGAVETPAETEIPDVLHEPSEVRVLVVNGTTVSGAAGSVNNDLIALGYNGLTPTNTNPIGAATATAVYYGPGYELDARQLAQSLNAPPTAVEPLPAEVPVDDLLEADVVIILGPDLVTG